MPASDRDRAALGALQMLRANLELSAVGEGQGIVFTSALPNEGKTTIVANLGRIMAASGWDVICVDADPREPSLTQHLGARPAGPGVVDVLLRSAAPTEVLQDVPLRTGSGADGARSGPDAAPGSGRGSRLRVLPRGRSAEPADVFRPKAVVELLDELDDLADYVLVDAPPLLVSADAFPLARAASLVVVVVRAGATSREAAEAARDTLDGLGIVNRAVVLNGARGSAPSGYFAPHAGRNSTGSGVAR